MRVCFFGDSFVNGVGDQLGCGWPARFAALAISAGHEITTYNLGIRGNTSADILNRWEAEADCRLVDGEPAGLLFSFGANDCADRGDGSPRLSQTDSLHNTEMLLGKAIRRAPTLMVGPSPILDDPLADHRIEQLDHRFQMLCQKLQVPYLSVFGFVGNCSEWCSEASAGDGTHPGQAGYDALSGYIGNWTEFQRWINQK